MSAFVVSNDTIDYIVSAVSAVGGVHGIVLKTGPEFLELVAAGAVESVSPTPLEMGRVLLRENQRSVQYRYNDDDLGNAALGYQFNRVDKTDPVVALVQVSCLRYQSCERPDWDASIACDLLRQIEQQLLRQLPGYEDAPWGWTRTDAEEPEFEVTWAIDLQAPSAEQAARKALEIMRDPESTATAFNVRAKSDGEAKIVDLHLGREE